MTTHTLLILDPAALKPENSELIMRSGSLTALKKLSDHGFLPAGDIQDAGQEILRLLTQERIPYRNTSDNHSGDQVIAENTDESTTEAGLGAGENPVSSGLNTVSVSTDESGRFVVDSGNSGSPESGNLILFTDWEEVTRHLLTGYRSARHIRKTKETDISLEIRLDGTGESRIETGIPFYDHMLEQIARHGYFDLDISCRGDLQIDEHHTIEDTAIALGEAIGKALGDKRGIGRYGFMVAMDETRSLAAIDLSGRPWCVFEGTFQREKVGDFPTEMTSHFFHSLAMALKATLHISVKGDNDHHKIEACFKALARCLRQAVDRNEKYLDILPSSKGLL